MDKKAKRDDRTKFYLGVSLLGLLLLGLIMFAIGSMGAEDDTEAWAALSIGLAVVVLAALFVKRQYASLKRGEPLEDERSNEIKLRAGSFGFKFGIYWMLVLMWYNIFAESRLWRLLEAEDVIALGIIGMSAAFLLSWLWYTKRG